MSNGEEIETRIVPVIMAGGSGTRLWPVSRASMPKQFISLLDGGRSTFQETLRRVSGPEFLEPIVVTGNDFRFVVAEQMQAEDIKGTIVLEPEGRDSAAAVAIGALAADRRYPDAVCVVLAADHAIEADAAFINDCVAAAKSAVDGRIMTLGIVPTEASSAYGYIECGASLPEEGAFMVERFVEKPGHEAAARLVSEGYLWNSGNFVFQASTMFEEMEAYAPQVLTGARAALDKAVSDLDFLRLDADAFAELPKISIDYAVMEKTKRCGVLRAGFGWSDIGAWDALHAIKTKDREGNVREGDVELIGVSNSFVRSDSVLTTVIGLDDVVVVTERDAVLVASRNATGDVKQLVATLKGKGRSEASEHLRIHRPWGWYERIDIGDRFQVKHICVKPGGRLSLQRHFHRAEHWVVVRGTAEVTIDDAVKFYHENEAAYLPIGCTHRLHNPGRIELKLIEVQVGSYTGEDDIVRIEDIYARS